ncbi:uncharacterized protein IUM83_04008 [Phytophthora cinnamomi]|uniref:uncharacterized protein n=1 Tax=Phytophthora cinnamomi TaxID=4785 RepID=UPI003559D946|nr:hypothetical protein IUM83_04008 [Phytophthora cinnamomi]
MKPRGRPPADGNFIAWTEALTATLLRLRFEKYAEPMAAARGTKALRLAWAEMATELTQQHDGDVVTVEQCRNKLKAMRNKWLAYHAGLASEPVCLDLMDSFWESEKEEMATSKSPRQPRPSSEQQKQAKRPRLALASSASAGEVKTDMKPLTLIAPAPSLAPAPTSLLSVPTQSSIGSAVSATTAPTSASSSLLSAPTATTQAGAAASSALGVGTQGLSDNATATVDAARLKESSPLVDSDVLSTLEKLIDDRFAKVLEAQEKQMRLTEAQNQLLTQVLATLKRKQYD